jgi:hypothetical protein
VGRVNEQTLIRAAILLGVKRRFFGFRFFDQLADPFGNHGIKDPLTDLAISIYLPVQFNAFVAHDSNRNCAS